jgi:hypothetical protein
MICLETNQTVNLLALRLRWFESSPAQIFVKMLMTVASRRLSTITSVHDSTCHGGELCRGYKTSWTRESLVAPSLATFAATAVSTTAATIAAATTTTGRSRFSRASLIHGQWPAFNCLSVEFRDGALSVLFGTHRDKRKATRFAGEFVLHEGNFLHRAGL